MLGSHVFCLSTLKEKRKYCPNPFFQMLLRELERQAFSCFAKYFTSSKSEGPTAPYVPSQDQVWPSSGTLIWNLFIDGCFVSRSVFLWFVWESHSAPTKRTLNSLNTLNFERFMLKFAKEIIWLFPRELMQCLVKKPFDISTEDYLHTTLGLIISIISNQYLSLKISFPTFLGFRLSW